ncbi:MAG: polysaccharide deacetylase family protein [Cellulosilyticaceae bacterium]
MKKLLSQTLCVGIILSLFLGNITAIKASCTPIASTNQSSDTACCEKVVYLTFDDGPTGKVTGKILDILKENDVKATFFIVGKEIPQRENILKRIYEEGHGIGLHTYTHNLNRIYTSPDAFIKEMEQTSAKINEVLGTNLDFKVIRFPGGSKGRLNEPFLDMLHQNNYKVFDWNVNLEDGVNPNLSPYTLVENSKKCSKGGTRRIILAHCNSSNKSTYAALPGIIKYYRDKGYTFKVIDNTTEEYYYRFKNSK